MLKCTDIFKMHACQAPPTQQRTHGPGHTPLIFSDFLDNKNLLSSDLHVSGGAGLGLEKLNHLLFFPH